jgi:hypothetical protein
MIELGNMSSSSVTPYLACREVVLQRESVKTSYGLALESFRNVIIVICAVRGSPAEKVSYNRFGTAGLSSFHDAPVLTLSPNSS